MLGSPSVVVVSPLVVRGVLSAVWAKLTSRAALRLDIKPTAHKNYQGW